MISAIAIDDELPALKIIERFAAETPALKLERVFTSTTEACHFLEENPVDLLFLDVQMPAMSGLDFFASSAGKSLVIFTTAFSEYAVESFALDAVDFLLKPFTPERFQRAVRKAEEYLEFKRHRDGSRDFIFIRADAAVVKVVTREIIYVEAADDYLRIFLEDKMPLTVRLTMKALVEMLPPAEFVRTHRSYIISFSRIGEIRNKTILLEGKSIPIGNLYEADLRRRLGR